MGAINYKSNDIITLGYNIPKKEKEAAEIAEEEAKNYGNNVEEIEVYYDEESYDYEEVKNILKKYNFNILKIALESGYYQGFYINLNFDLRYFDNTEEKKEALKETTKLKKLLLELLQINMVSYSPGWLTSYSTEEETKEEIKEAIKNLKEEIKSTLTEKRYFKKYDIWGNLKEV